MGVKVGIGRSCGTGQVQSVMASWIGLDNLGIRILWAMLSTSSNRQVCKAISFGC